MGAPVGRRLEADEAQDFDERLLAADEVFDVGRHLVRVDAEQQVLFDL